MKGHSLLSVLGNIGKERDSHCCGPGGYEHLNYHFTGSPVVMGCPNSTDGVGAELTVGKEVSMNMVVGPLC